MAGVFPTRLDILHAELVTREGEVGLFGCHQVGTENLLFQPAREIESRTTQEPTTGHHFGGLAGGECDHYQRRGAAVAAWPVIGYRPRHPMVVMVPVKLNSLGHGPEKAVGLAEAVTPCTAKVMETELDW